MKILMLSFDTGMLSDDENRSGDTRARHRLYAAHLRQTYPEGQITVLVRAGAQTPTVKQTLGESLELYPIPGPRALFALRALRLARQLMRSTRFDLVATQTPFDDGLAGWLLKRRYRLPLHVQMNSSFLDMLPWINERPLIYRAFNWLGKFVASRADSIRVVCQGEKARLEQHFPHLRGKIAALHPYINADFFDTADPSQDGAPVVLFVGRLVKVKNIPNLLKASAELHAQSQPFKLVVVGEGPEKADLQRLAQQLALRNSVQWAGALSHEQIRQLFAAARLTVLPSFYEGFGRVVAESALQGTPVIATPFVSAPELIRNGFTGFVLDSFTDHNELADRIGALLASATRAREMGAAAQAHMRSYLSTGARYLDRLIAIWEATYTGAKLP